MVLSDLQALFQDWLDRSDITTDRMNLFVARGQARIQRECRLPCMERVVSAVPDANGYLSRIGLPEDFLETQRIDADGTFLQMVTPEFLLQQTGTPTVQPAFNNLSAYIVPSILVGAPPQFAARIGNVIQFVPYPQSYANLYYYGQFGALVNPTDSNALLDVSPECLLFAALSYAGDFYRMDETQTWDARYQAERDALKQLALDADNGGLMVVQSSYDGGYL